MSRVSQFIRTNCYTQNMANRPLGRRGAFLISIKHCGRKHDLRTSKLPQVHFACGTYIGRSFNSQHYFGTTARSLSTHSSNRTTFRTLQTTVCRPVGHVSKSVRSESIQVRYPQTSTTTPTTYITTDAIFKPSSASREAREWQRSYTGCRLTKIPE